MSDTPKNWVIAQAYGKTRIPDVTAYAMETTDLDDCKADLNLKFGDKVWVIKAKTLKILGNDGEFYDM